MTLSLTGCSILTSLLKPPQVIVQGYCPLPVYMSAEAAAWYKAHEPLPDAVANDLNKRDIQDKKIVENCDKRK